MSGTTQPGLSDNAAGAIAYITIVPAIVFLVLPPYNASPYVRFHAWQSILLNAAAFIIDVAVGFVLTLTVIFAHFGYFGLHMIWPLVDLVWLATWILCVVKAVNGQRFKLPIIGALAEQLANK